MGSDIVHVRYPRGVTILAAACAILFVIIGLIGNLITVLALLRSRRLRGHATTCFILSLSVSDLLFCSINLPILATRYIHEEWILGDTLCRIFPFFFYGNVATSLMSLVAITINRYILITHYSLYEKIYRARRISIMVALVWFFSFSMLFPPLIEIWGRFGLNESTFSCTILKKNGKSPKKFLFIFGILLPCLVIIYCYSRIFFEVRKSQKRVTKYRTESPMSVTNQGADSTMANGRNDWRLTKMMLLIFCCFLICFLPLLIFNVIDDEVKLPTLHVLASILAWSSSVINPFIYAFANTQYRQAYIELFTGNGLGGSVAGSTSGIVCGQCSFMTEMVQVNIGKFNPKNPQNGNVNG